MIGRLPLLVLVLASSTGAQTWVEVPVPERPALRVAVLEPEGLEPSRPVPVLLGLPPGQQNRAMVEVCIERYWGERTRDAGWVVVCPVAPVGEDAVRFDQDEDARSLGALCRWIRSRYAVEGGGIHLAGVSNGGRAAFRAATRLPWQFASLTVLPGFPPAESDRLRLPWLRHMTVSMYVGGDDTDWLERAQATAERLRSVGGTVSLEVFEGEGHVPVSLTEDTVLTRLEGLRARPDPTDRWRAVHAALDAFHVAAAQADAERYFGAFADEDSIFLGTDATERWTVPEFREWAKKAFAEGRDAAWTFVPLERHVRGAGADDASGIAWFDERLGNATFGECRGSGVMVQREGDWKVAHYVLSLPVPNDLATSLVADVRAHELEALRTPAATGDR